MTDDKHEALENKNEPNEKPMRKPVVRQTDVVTLEPEKVSPVVEIDAEEPEEVPEKTGKLKTLWNSRAFSNALVVLSVICFILGG